jgi:uncharacterized protein YicC (UPF0701 family)
MTISWAGTLKIKNFENRPIDVVVTLPRELSEMEPRVRDMINSEITRGRLTVVIALHYGPSSSQRLGLDTALASGMKEIAVFMSASETHNKKNVNKTIAATLAALEEGRHA